MFSVERISVAYATPTPPASWRSCAPLTLVRCSGYDSLNVAQEIFAHDPNKAIRLLYSRRFT
jgi:hypothetical protein